MKKRLILITTLVLLLILTACSPKEEAVRPKGIFFEVNGGKNSVYLFGSIHAGSEDMFPVDKIVEDAFAKADTLVLEVDLANIDPMALAQEMASYGLYMDGTRLKDVAGEELFNRVLSRLSPLGVDEAALNQFRPWYASLVIAQLAIMDSAYSAEYGVDMYFMGKAGTKQMIGLETATDQFKPFTLMSQDSEVLYLQKTMDDIAKIDEELEELVTLWREGNVARVAELRTKMIEEAQTESIQEYTRALTDDRDEKMAAKIAELLEGDSRKNYFVVVGYLHLGGENSIVDRLQKMGYKVQVGN